MTTSEKIKQARIKAGLSQEQFAEKLCVSRQAVTKWETGNGLPDIENLAAIAKLLDVSIDYLLDNGQNFYDTAIKEPINLSLYGKGGRKKVKDKIVREKYPDAEIHPLIAKTKLTKKEKIFDNLIGIFTDAPFGTAEVYNSAKSTDKQYYLAEKDGRQYLVLITDEYILSRQMERRQEDKFETCDMKFIKCKYKVK
ncbi:MAG: helix-turn-helix domain-containing protein [Clostridia bacterium]|nr:helix-turn-helix domain-containing protein [Clostridia bacterium]